MMKVKSLFTAAALASGALPAAYAQDGLAEGAVTDPAAVAAEPAPVAAEPAPAVEAASPATAEAEPEATKKSGSRLIEEIIVTAQKREENLQAVPISVQAFSPEALDARGITNQSGLMKATPGLDVGSNAGFTTIFLRGVGTEAFLTADPSIANYIDGVYYPFSPSFSQEFGAVKRVEVLKGPQGTLFGRNAVGGAINVITEVPDFLEPKTTVSYGMGDYSKIKGSVYTNVPITDEFAINVSGFYSSADSYFKGSTAGGDPLEKEISSGVRVKARWAPTEDLDLLFGVTKTHAQDNSDFPINLYPSPLGLAVGVPPRTDKKSYKGASNENLYGRTEIQVVQFEGRYNMPWFDVKLLASDQFIERPFNYDFEGSERPLVAFDIQGHSADIQEAELQILSNSSSPGADWLTFTAGVFWFENKQGFDPIRATVGDLDLGDLEASFDGLIPDGVSDALAGLLGPEGSLATLLSNAAANGNGIGFTPGQIALLFDAPYYHLDSQALARTRSLSEYLQVTGRFADWVALTIGLRYQNEYRGVIHANTRVVIDPNITIGVLDWTTARDNNGSVVPNNARTKRLTPAFTLDFNPFEDDTLIYVSYKEAVKAHAYNTYAIYLPPEKVKAEETTAYEVGWKTKMFDNNLRLSAAAFEYRIKNLQTQFVSLVNGGAVSFETADKAKIRGVDFDMTFSILPDLIDGLDGSLNGCWLETAEYVKYDPASGYAGALGLFNGSNNFSGNRITRSPKFTSSAVLNKTFLIPGGPLEIGADYYYNSGYFLSASNEKPDFHQPNYNTVGAHISYLYEPWQMRASLAGSNLTDEYYTAGVIGLDFGTNYHVAPPSQWFFKLDWTF